MFKIYGAGNNAWNQLKFTSDTVPSPTDPEDLESFTELLRSTSQIDLLTASLTYTLVRCQDKLVLAGCPPYGPADPDMDLQILAAVTDGLCSINFTSPPITLSSLCNITIPIHGDRTVVQADNYDAGLLLLLDNGSIWVIGDPRFPDCLGIPDSIIISPVASLSNRSLTHVTFFDNVKDRVIKVRAGGYTLAVITSNHELYVWGGRPRQTSPFEEISGTPGLVDSDVSDVAIGSHHALILDSSGEVSGRGGNNSGQLGKATEDWPGAWSLDIEAITPNEKVVEVHAGPHTSFLITRKTHTELQL